MQKSEQNYWLLEPCEKADTCEGAKDNCKRYGAMKVDSPPICNLPKRWMYCYAWKQKLGMVFDKDLGVYILPEDKEKLMERARK